MNGLHHDGDSAIHRLAPEVKVVAAFAFVVAVVATPPDAYWAFAVDAAVVIAAVVAARLPARWVVRRLRIELPFLAFALLLPLAGATALAAWNIVAKGFLGVGAAIVLSATTPVPELLAGLERLRVPRVLTAIAGFMARYVDVIAGDLDRMRIARASRGDDPRWLWQARGVAATAGTLFVRSYERGERVHLAMLARGYDGTMPMLHRHDPPAGASLLALGAPAIAVAVTVLARLS